MRPGQGRVDYGPRIGEPKGLIGPVRINGEQVRGWQVLPLPLDDIARVGHALRAQPAGEIAMVAGPAFARSVFDLPEPSDLNLSTSGPGKGIAWINGFCLGRYWSRGPQQTLYVPGPVTRRAGNGLIILELHSTASDAVTFVSASDPGPAEHLHASCGLPVAGYVW